ncbi:MAG: adenosylmethionine decarboxylase [Nitrososphaerota archaeon]
MLVEKESSSGVVGKHIYGNLYGCDPKVLSNLRFLRNVVQDAVKVASMNLVELKAWKFGGERGGVSVIALVVESHIALHTWPSYKYATLDIYTCGDNSDPERAFEMVCKTLKPDRVVKYFADRSSVPQGIVSP